MYKEIDFPSLPFSLLPSPSSFLPFPLLLPFPPHLLSLPSPLLPFFLAKLKNDIFHRFSGFWNCFGRPNAKDYTVYFQILGF